MQDGEVVRDEASNSLRVATVATLAAAFISQNHTTIDGIPAVMAAFTSEVDKLLNGAEPVVEEAPAEKPVPFTTIKKSINPDYIVSLFDGRRLKSLKRYLRTSHNMTPEEYKAYWGLPKDYPMVAPNYAAKRSELAKSIGLGRGGRQGARTAPAATAAAASASDNSSNSTPAAEAEAPAKATRAKAAPKAKVKSSTSPKAPKAAAAKAPKATKAKAPTKADLNKLGVGGGEATAADIKVKEPATTEA